jgi:hypothetical protein
LCQYNSQIHRVPAGRILTNKQTVYTRPSLRACRDGNKITLPFSCLKLGRKFVVILAGYESGRYSGHYLPTISPCWLLIYTCFCAFTMQTRSTANGKIRREIQKSSNVQNRPGPESYCQAIYFKMSKNVVRIGFLVNLTIPPLSIHSANTETLSAVFAENVLVYARRC